MREYPYSAEYDGPLIAELYDQSEAYADDVALLRSLIGGAGPLGVLEPFSGTGRVLIPLAQDGHRVTGIEIARAMVERTAAKLAALGDEVRARVALRLGDALDGGWGHGYDLVVMGANAFYELPSAETQERCIRFAREALVEGGHLFVDNNDYKGDWGRGPFGRERVVFEGVGSDGTYGRWSVVGLGFDEAQGVLRMKRAWYARSREGVERRAEYLGRKHPVSAGEVEGWLQEQGFDILNCFGDRRGNPYTKESGRAIFWARKR